MRVVAPQSMTPLLAGIALLSSAWTRYLLGGSVQPLAQWPGLPRRRQLAGGIDVGTGFVAAPALPVGSDA
eukprot:5500913-Pyramimonas_sp.AAC.1